MMCVMRVVCARLLVLAIGLVIVAASPSRSAAATRNFAVEVHAVAQESPPRLDFSWRADPSAAEYRVFKKAVAESLWTGPIATLGGGATSFSDDDVAVGETYEYSFEKTRGIVIDTVAVTSGTAVTFTINDSWGDGICCEQGLGSYEVTGCGVGYAAGGAFGSSESTSFVVGSPEHPCSGVVIAVTLDIFGTETTWSLVDDSTGSILAQGGPYSAPKFGHILAGIRAPELEDAGTVLLLVAEPVVDSLAAELSRLEMDMIRDGYRVARRLVPDGTAVPAVKDLIVEACQSDQSISTLFLLGQIAVPYSGDIRGAHANHFGAWPADVYYGELDGVWTDSVVNNTSSTWPANHNVPGDGKFDQTYLPSDVDLEVGRVDLSRMTTFPESEVELLRRYLDKDHAFRSGEITVPRRGIIKDNVGELDGVAYACTGWRNFTAMFGPSGVGAASWLPTLETEAYLAAYGCGAGSFTSCSGVITTADFATRSIHAVFTMLMGSYFGDWDKPDDLLRASLGSAGYPLTCCWAGRPAWQMHHMALGYPIGHSARVTQNNHTLYMIGYGGRQVHIGLMGDPTLKLHVVKPPQGPGLEDLAEEGVGLAWGVPDDSVSGYHVYRAATIAGDFDRLNPTLIIDTVYVDHDPLPGRNVYMVRAVKLEVSASGTYFNLSPGAVDSIEVTAGVIPATGDTGAADATLLGSAPNPFAAGTDVAFRLTRRTRAVLTVHDTSGRLLRTVDGGWLGAGRHALRWDGRDSRGQTVAPGVYFLSVGTGRSRLSGKAVRVE